MILHGNARPIDEPLRTPWHRLWLDVRLTVPLSVVAALFASHCGSDGDSPAPRGNGGGGARDGGVGAGGSGPARAQVVAARAPAAAARAPGGGSQGTGGGSQGTGGGSQGTGGGSQGTGGGSQGTGRWQPGHRGGGQGTVAAARIRVRSANAIPTCGPATRRSQLDVRGNQHQPEHAARLSGVQREPGRRHEDFRVVVVHLGQRSQPRITDQHIQQVLDGLNEDMAYIRDVMGWPPDPMPQAGYFSSVYLYGSGLCTDNASNTEQGGWQSSIGPYPMVLLSWAPVVNYDRGGITHEAIHAMVKGTPGGNNKAHWFNEGGNTWIQMQLGARRDGRYGVGFLDGAPFVAPHQPIECYSGWLLDGSFGGPDAEGVGDCNWRRYLGGTQYNSILLPLPRALRFAGRQRLGLAATKPPQHSRDSRVRPRGGADPAPRHGVSRAAGAGRFRPWRDSIINTGINNSWGQTLNRECGSGTNPPDYLSTAYAPTTTSGSTITPDDYTLPGWSGANQIPLNVTGNEVRLNFKPVGANMRMQLAYWATDGTAVYSQPKESGQLCLRLDKAPKGGVVIAVVSNTDYVYAGDATRRAKYDYSIEMVQGVTSTASRTTKWFIK